MNALNGKWKVTALGSLADFMNWFEDHKIISGDEGHNEAKMGINGGYFHIEPLANNLGYKLIYDHEKNPAMIRGIVDTIVPQSKESYFGTLCNKGEFCFNFLLEKVE